MNETTERVRRAVIEQAVRGPGVSDSAQRQAAFDNTGVDARARPLIDTVARNAWKVTEAQVRSAVAAGLAEDAVFELAVCAALGQATRQRAAAQAVVDQAFGKTAASGDKR
jgi:hypothetical protein